MTDWDKLWRNWCSEEPDEEWNYSHNWIERVKAEGDKLQQKLQDAESWTEKGFVVIYKEKMDELKKALNGRNRSEDIILSGASYEAERKLEAIREILNRPHSKSTPSEEYATKLDEIDEVLGE